VTSGVTGSAAVSEDAGKSGWDCSAVACAGAGTLGAGEELAGAGVVGAETGEAADRVFAIG